MLKSVKAKVRDDVLYFYHSLQAGINEYNQRHNSNNNGLQAVVIQSRMIGALALILSHQPSKLNNNI